MVRVGSWIANRFEVYDVHLGGMGVVFVVYDHQGSPGRRVLAMKRLRDEYLCEPMQVARFVAECKTWITLERHPNIVRAYSVQVLEGEPYVLCELVTGGSLRRWIGTPRLDLPQTLRFSIQFCLGMEHAVQHGLHCHRDIKPENLLITEGGTLKVTDFGLAKVRDEVEALGFSNTPIPLEDAPPDAAIIHDEPVHGARSSRPGDPVPREDRGLDFDPLQTIDWPASPPETSDDPDATQAYHGRKQFGESPPIAGATPELTDAGSMLGTGRYMAPEQCRDARTVDLRADIYSFGVVLFEMITGVPPFRGKSVSELSYQHANDQPPYLAPYVPRRFRRVAKRLARIVQRCLEKDPHRRYQSIGELRTDLARCLVKAIGERLAVPSELEIEAWELTGRGVSLGTLGRFDEERATYEDALRIKHDYVPAWFNLAAALGSMGLLVDALEHADLALQLSPSSIPALINKGLALQGLGRPADALSYLDHAAEIQPRDPEVWRSRSFVLREQGDDRGSALALKRANSLGLSAATIPSRLQRAGGNPPPWVRRTEDFTVAGTEF